AAAVPILIGYAALSGWQVSTLRALAMVVLALTSAGLARPRSVPSVLAAAALALAVIWPPVLEDPGLHLSIAALVGLFWLAPGLEARLLPPRPAWETRLLRRRGVSRATAAAGKAVVRISCASAGAALATLPISLFHFGSAPLAGILTNLVAVPMVGWLGLPLGLAGILAYEPLPGAARLLWTVAGTVLDRWTAAMAAVEPWALSVRLPALETPLGLVAGLAGLAALGHWVWRRPGGGRWAAGAAGLALVALALPGVRTTLDHRLRLWVFDVGQGQALALRLPGGSWIAVDGGGFPQSPFDPGARILVPALEALGCQGLEVVVSTHPHPDHVGGLPTVVRWGRPGEVWLPAGFRGDPRYLELLAAGREVGARVRWIGPAVEKRTLGGARVLAWCGPGPGENDRSLLMRVEAWGRAVLLPADLEAAGQAAALASGIPLGAETLVAPHHGAADAWYPPFFRAVAPRWVLVSASGRRGLPSERFLRGAEGFGAPVFGTYDRGCLRLDLGPSGSRAGPAR
ncbi:MAG: MBL fold metallo-hydrolase, partial [Deltaproteobacteria bacterium]|nr:MBL fold metallo-hydrolase [Deltaproteobacteria bacterium]